MTTFNSARASEAINGLRDLVKSMYLFGPEGFEEVRIDGKRLPDIVAELGAAESIDQVLSALNESEK